MVLISQVLPQGLMGLMTAALLAALMSTISAALNSVGTLVSIDIVKRILTRRGNDKVALYTMVFGLLAGATVFCLDFEPISGVRLITDGLGIPFLMQAWWLFVMCIVCYSVLGLTSKPRPLAEIENLIFTKKDLMGYKSRIRSIKDPRIWALTLFIIMVLLYIYFG